MALIDITGTKRRDGILGWWRRRWTVAALALALLLLFPLFSPVEGAPQSELLKQQLDQQLAKVEQSLAQLRTLEAELAALEAEADAAAQRLADIGTDIGQVEDEIDQAQVDLEEVRLQLESRLVGIYKGGASWSAYYLQALLVEDDLSAVIERFHMVSKMASLDQELFEEVEGYIEVAKENKAALEQKQVDQEAELTELQQAWEKVSAKRAQMYTQLQSYQSQAATLKAKIKQAEAQEAAAAAAAAAKLEAMNKEAQEASGDVGSTPPPTTTPTTKTSTPTTSPGTTTPTTAPATDPNAGKRRCPTTEAEIAAQAAFIERTWLIPRNSVLTGRQIMDLWIKYNISPAESLTVLSEESGMGSTTNGGRLVTEGNNFGGLRWSESPSWMSWPPAITHGKIYVANRTWLKFYSVQDGIEGWGRYIANGLGRDYYRPLMRACDWDKFADTYYGKWVAGVDEYTAKLYWTYGMLKGTAAKAGYYW